MNKLKTLIIILLTLTICTSCSTKQFLNFYQKVNERVGDIILTNERKLKGIRRFGTDHYTGTYQATYKNFQGEEVIFGGTTTKRDSENIHIKLTINDSSGNLKVIMHLKEKEEVLATTNGTYEYVFPVKDGSNYLIVNASKYSGKLYIEIY